MAFEDVGELEITRDGDVIMLKPVRPSGRSFAQEPAADADFLDNSVPVVDDEGRFQL